VESLLTYVKVFTQNTVKEEVAAGRLINAQSTPTGIYGEVGLLNSEK
jgi:hypothetical protein